MLGGALGFGETLQTWLGADKTSPSTEPDSHFGSFGRICLQQWKSRSDNPVPGSAAGNRTGMCSTRGVKRRFSRCGLSSCSVLWEFCEDRGEDGGQRVEDDEWRVKGGG